MQKKEEALQYVQMLAAQKILTKTEVNAAYDAGSAIMVQADVLSLPKTSMVEVLYYFGGGIIFFGIAIFLAQNWGALSFATKIAATLGGGIAAYIVGVLFSIEEKTARAGSAFYFLSALLMPIGLQVLFEHAGFSVWSVELQCLISGILFITYLLSYFVFKKNVLVLFSILFATWLFFSLISFIVSREPHFYWVFYDQAYRVLVAGIAYILLGHAFLKNSCASLSDFLHSFGMVGFLGAALALGGWEPNQNVMWECVYPGLVFGAVFYSVYIQSTACLTWSVLFFVAYIFKITAEYFLGSLGWPLMLVISGLIMICIGYVFVSMKQKYFSS